MAVCLDLGGPETCQAERTKSGVLETHPDPQLGMLRCWVGSLGPSRRGGLPSAGVTRTCLASRKVKSPLNSSLSLKNSYVIEYKKKLTVSVAEHQNRLLGEVGESPSLELFKTYQSHS